MLQINSGYDAQYTDSSCYINNGSNNCAQHSGSWNCFFCIMHTRAWNGGTFNTQKSKQRGGRRCGNGIEGRHATDIKWNKIFCIDEEKPGSGYRNQWQYLQNSCNKLHFTRSNNAAG